MSAPQHIPPPGDPLRWWKWDYARNQPMLAEWEQVRSRIPPEALAEIIALHKKNKYECCGYSESQFCCIDFLDGRADQSYRDMISKLGGSPDGDSPLHAENPGD